jgi:hypothetical protein
MCSQQPFTFPHPEHDLVQTPLYLNEIQMWVEEAATGPYSKPNDSIQTPYTKLGSVILFPSPSSHITRGLFSPGFITNMPRVFLTSLACQQQPYN